jgi:ABC transport system ATP-binding/permease protein
MIPYIQAEELAKRYGERLLFENFSFTVSKGEKVALIAPNGAGKSSLLDIVAGREAPDSGRIVRTNHIAFGYFEQVPVLNNNNTVLGEIFTGQSEKIQIIKEFEAAVVHQQQDEITRLSEQIDLMNAWDTEVEIRQILTQLKINDLDAKVGTLSGGQKKRLALAKVLIGQPEFLILDEPTNHLDLEMIEWLEKYLARSTFTLLMVTHDRYFLDRICTEIIEIDNGLIYRYKTNYSGFVQKRDERINAQQAGIAKAQNLLRTEIEWMRRMPKARTTKAKYRVEAFDELQENASPRQNEKSVRLDVKSARLGTKILDIKGIDKSYGDIKLLHNFTYSFSRFEKAGIIGANGSGKSTFLNLITGLTSPDSGIIETGQTIKFGYYRQDGIVFNPGDRVIEAVTKIADEVQFEDGNRISVSQMLTKFLFPPAAQYDYFAKLSGGEKRRLYLCTVLMQNPNFLILDEPTNDLDIMTLNILEEYLRSFAGCVVVVSHDRFFMDKIVDHIFVFEGAGKITDFPGNYTQYRNWFEENETLRKPSEKEVKTIPQQKVKRDENVRLSFKEKREFEQLESEIKELEKKKAGLERLLNSESLDHETLYLRSRELENIHITLDEKELRWLELSEKI